MSSIYKRRRMDRKRRERLMRKIQKARALPLAEVILSLPTWGKRFGRTAKVRARGGFQGDGRSFAEDSHA